MKIQYLGTAAYDAIPSPFCRCETCMRSRKLGGKNIRTRSQALVNGDLLLDFNPDTVAHFLTYGIDWDRIDNCLITHSHEDHLYVSDMAIPQFGTNPHRVHYFAGSAGYQQIMDGFRAVPILFAKDLVAVTQVVSLQEFYAGGYRILPVPADHDPKSSPFLYAIERDGKRMLYAHDTGIFPEETVQALKEFGRFDLISFDCTGATATKGWRKGHMSLKTDLEMVERLTRDGIMDSATIKVANHFSHNGGATYDEIEKSADSYGFLVSYDGMTIEF